MAITHRNRVQMSVTGTPGTGTITLNAAVSAYQTFAAAYAGNATVDVLITDGTAWEVARGCAYTNSGTTLTRGTLEASSTGSAISLTSAAVVSEVMTAAYGNELDTQRQSFIAGLVVTKNSGGNTLDISAGACYDPSSGKVISYAGATAVSAGSLGASQWNQVYIYDNAGTATVEVVNNAAPPSSVYAGTARQGGTNGNRRWIGSFLTDGSSNIKAWQAVTEVAGSSVLYTWKTTNTYDAPHRILSGGTATTFTAVSLATVIPRYVCAEALLILVLGYSTTGAADESIGFSVDGTNQCLSARSYVYSAGAGIPVFPLWAPLEIATPQIYYKVAAVGVGVGPTLSIDVQTYRVVR